MGVCLTEQFEEEYPELADLPKCCQQELEARKRHEFSMIIGDRNGQQFREIRVQ